MNHASKILSYLAAEDGAVHVILVAGAPPLERRGRELRVIVDTVLSPDDIRDTLATLAGHARLPALPAANRSADFSFGIHSLGRFRVHHATQRGSDLVVIRRMPLTIPDLALALDSTHRLADVDHLFSEQAGGIVVVTGPSAAALSRVVYGAVARVNERANRILYLIESNLSYALKHRKAIVIQVEAGTDCASIDEALRDGLAFHPDLLYVREPQAPPEFAALVRASESGCRVIVSEPALSDRHLLAEWRRRAPEECEALIPLIVATLQVTEQTDDRLSVQIGFTHRASSAPA